MPYFRNNVLQDQENESNNPSQVKLAGGSQEGGEAAGVGGTPKNTGSNFTNIDKYLKANAGNNFGQTFQNKALEDINKDVQTVHSGLENETGNLSNYGTTASHEDIGKAVANPTSFKPEDYQKWMNNTYSGPKSYQDTGSSLGTASAVKHAGDVANAAGTESGRSTLLDTYFGRPNYSSGEKALDSLLATQGGGFNAAELQKQASSLSDYDRSAEQKFADATKARATALSDTSNYAKEALGGAVNDLNAKSNTAFDIASSKWGELKNDLEKGTISPGEYEALGIDKDSGLYGADLSKYLKAAPTRSSLMSKEDYARYKALNELGGMSPAFAFNPDELGSYDASGAGFGGSYDKAGLAGAINQGKTDYTSAFNPLQASETQSERDVAGAEKDLEDVKYGLAHTEPNSMMANQMRSRLSQAQKTLAEKQSQSTSIQSSIDELNKKYGVKSSPTGGGFKSINGMLGRKER